MTASNHVDVQRKNWLIPFLRSIFSRASASAVREEGQPASVWELEQLRDRGLLTGCPSSRWPREGVSLTEKSQRQWRFLNFLTHKTELLIEQQERHRHRSSLDHQFDVLISLSAAVGAFDLAQKFYAVSQDSLERGESLAERIGAPARKLGAELLGSSLFEHDERISKLPFFRVIVYARAREALEAGRCWLETEGAPNEAAFTAALMPARRELHALIEAIVVLMNRDGHLSKLERHLIDAVMDIANIPRATRRVLSKSRREPEAIAEEISSPLSRRFIFEQMIVYGMLDSDYNDDERRFVERFGQALGIDEETQRRCEGEALVFLHNNIGMVEALGQRGQLRQFKDLVTRRVEGIVSRSSQLLLTEVQETQDLMKLLLKRTQAPLEPEEEERVRAQLLDICKTIPSLAVFVVPGGSILLPILIRVLPFNLLPTAFVEEDESL